MELCVGYVCIYDETCVLDMSFVKFVCQNLCVETCVFKLNEFKKKQGLYRIQRTTKKFAIRQQTAKMPRGSSLYSLGAVLFGYFAVRWLTAKVQWSLPSAS